MMILKDENKVGRLIVQNIKTFYKAIIIKTVCYWNKEISLQWIPMEQIRVKIISIHILSPNFQKQVLLQLDGKKIAFSINSPGSTGYPYIKKLTFISTFYHTQKLFMNHSD